jgi:Homeodomain-like domain
LSQAVAATVVDVKLRSLLLSIRSKHREPLGRTYHLHQLDGAQLEAMVELHRNGVYIQWAHGHGDCAITGAGHALLAVLMGERSADDCEAAGDLVLYGDRDLIQRAPDVFTPRPGDFPGSDTYAVRLNRVSGPLIAAWAEAGGRPSEIAAAYGVDRRTVIRWQQRLGFKWRPPANPSRESLPKLWAQPLTLHEMGTELGVTTRTVSRWARKLQLPPRRPV